MTDEIDLGRMTSQLLVEVRTVLSRAQTALTAYDWCNEDWRHDGDWILQAELVTVPGRYDWLPVDDPRRVEEQSIPHPDREEIREALVKVVELLSPWERTGRPLKKKL